MNQIHCYYAFLIEIKAWLVFSNCQLPRHYCDWVEHFVSMKCDRSWAMQNWPGVLEVESLFIQERHLHYLSVNELVQINFNLGFCSSCGVSYFHLQARQDAFAVKLVLGT